MAEAAQQQKRVARHEQSKNAVRCREKQCYDDQRHKIDTQATTGFLDSRRHAGCLSHQKSLRFYIEPDAALDVLDRQRTASMTVKPDDERTPSPGLVLQPLLLRGFPR